MRPKFVSQNEIQKVLDGFETFYKQCLETEEFGAADMMKFMEPIFTANGWRQIPDADSKTNILVLHDAGVGDFILMSAALRELRRLYPAAHITLLLRHGANALAENCPYVDEVMININPLDWREFSDVYDCCKKMAAELLSRRYDIAFSFTHYAITILLAYMSGARERISFEFGEDNQAFEVGPLIEFSPFVTVEAPKCIYGSHALESGLALISAMTHAPIDNRDAEVWYSPTDYAIAAKFLRSRIRSGWKMYALCLGGMSLRKKWSAERYAELIKMILERESNISIVILGAGEDDANAAETFKQTLGREICERHILDLTDGCTYRISAVLLSFCDMYIGNDTGTMHLAAAVKTPVLSPSCFATDIDVPYNVTQIYYPYRVPSVTVLVRHALPDCLEAKNGVGCIREDTPHCILQITTEKMFSAYEMLKTRIKQNIIEPLFIS